MEKQKKSYGKTALIVLLLIVTIASLVLATYAWAKYSSVTEGTATAQVAKWNVGVAFDSNNMDEQYQHVKIERLAPGMKGSFDITINANDTEVDFDYEIIFLGATAEYANESDSLKPTAAKVPAHLHFYTDETDHTTENEINVNQATQTPDSNAESYLRGKLGPTAGESNAEVKTETKKIYWEWPYEDPNHSTTDTQKINEEGTALETAEDGNGIKDYDDQDTLDGMHPVIVTVAFKVVSTQMNPTKQ